MVVRFFVRVRVIRYQAEGIQVGCDSFQHTDHQRSVESNKLRSETRASKSPFPRRRHTEPANTLDGVQAHPKPAYLIEDPSRQTRCITVP